MKDGAAAEDKYTTGRMRQQKKKILHKLCIDMERSEYTSFSMLARIHLVLHVSDIKMRVPMNEYFNAALHGFEGMR